MSYHYYFSFAQGLNKTIKVPAGTYQKVKSHIDSVEQTLNIKRTKYLDNPQHWESTNYENIDDEILCKTVENHNWFVRRFYENLHDWANKTIENKFEELTNDLFQDLLPGLQTIIVRPERWTAEYYHERMNTLFEVMKGNETEGISFDEKKLTPKQAAGVIRLFSEFLDTDDVRLDLPKGSGMLERHDDGGYVWCDKCGAITYEHSLECRKRGCPLRAERKAEGLDY